MSGIGRKFVFLFSQIKVHEDVPDFAILHYNKSVNIHMTM